MKNVIAYVAPKNKTMLHSMILKNRIYCVVGISIFAFKTYWKQVFDLMDIQTTHTFKHLLQAKTLNAKNNNSYYKQYDVKRLRTFHKKEMTKQKNYENMLARQIGMDYSPGIQLQTILINMGEVKEHTMINQPEKKQQKRCRCGSIKHLRFTSKYCSVGHAIMKEKKSSWGWGYLNPKQGRQHKMQHQRKRVNVWRQRPLGRVKNQMREHHQ